MSLRCITIGFFAIWHYSVDNFPFKIITHSPIMQPMTNVV